MNKNGSVQNKILQRAVRKDNLGKGEEVEGTWWMQYAKEDSIKEYVEQKWLGSERGRDKHKKKKNYW